MHPELTLIDYLTVPIVELAKWPDFDADIHAAALRLSQLRGREILQADMVKTRNHGGNE